MEIQGVATVPIEPRRSTLEAFRHTNFRLFFIGQTISLIGTWSQSLAISWLVWRITHSAAWLGIIGFTIQFPMLIFGLPGGVAADKFDRLKILTAMQVLCMVQAIVLSVLTLTGLVNLWHILVLSALLGTIYAFEFPVRQSFVMDMVGKKDLLNAISLNAAMIHATRIAGPVVAGIIVAWKDEGICFLFNAATFIFLIAALLAMDRRRLAPAQRETRNMVESILEGLRFVRRERHVKIALFLASAICALGMTFISLMPIFADQVFGGGAIELGWLIGASGLGAVGGALWLARRPSGERLLQLSLKTSILFSLALIAFGLIHVIWIAIPILAVVGFFLEVSFAGLHTHLQQAAPDPLRGRVMSLFTTAFMGVAPFGSLIGGLLAREIGAPMTVVVSGVASAVVGVILWLRIRG